MLIYLSNNQAKRRYLFQNRQRRFPKGHLLQLFSIRVTLSKPLTTIYNRLNFDLGTIGNHEFNYGLPYLIDTHYKTLTIQCFVLYFRFETTFTGEGVHYFEKKDQQ